MKLCIALVLLFQLTACTVFTVRHEEGSLPDIEIESCSKICNDDCGAKIKQSEFEFRCKRKV